MLKLAHPIASVDIEASLAKVEAGCGVETANLLRAVFKGFHIMAQGAGVPAELISGTDDDGKTCLYLVMKFDSDGRNGSKAQD